MRKEITIALTHAIADTGATSKFILKGTPVKNLRTTNNPITISLPDGSKVTLTHMCDINIPGLSTVLTGYIVPGIIPSSVYKYYAKQDARLFLTTKSVKCSRE